MYILYLYRFLHIDLYVYVYYVSKLKRYSLFYVDPLGTPRARLTNLIAEGGTRVNVTPSSSILILKCYL